MYEINRIIDTDSYKASHYLQFPPNTTLVHSYLESRGTDRHWERTVFFGLQYILKRYFAERFTLEMVEEAREVITAHGLPFNYEGWKSVVTKYDGKMPFRVRAVAEGSVVPIKNALMTVENTDPEFYWLTSWFETQLMRIWYPITVATQSYYIKQNFYKFLQETSDDADAEIDFKVHDFGSRGVSSKETAAIGGAAHLVNFLGTDTMSSLILHRDFYGEAMAGFSIPAAEHSTMTAWGRENEIMAYRNMLQNFAKPGAILAVVSDSWNIYEACEKIWGEQLRQEVVDSEATVVIRPDCYDETTEILTEKGWKLFSKAKGLKVAQVDANFSLSFVHPTNFTEQNYIGEMIKFNDGFGRLDLLVTPNHRMVMIDQKRNIFVKEAKTAKFRYNRSIPRIAKAPENGVGIIPFERFLIAFQADGSYPSGFEKIQNPGILAGYIKVRFNFSKDRKTERLTQICKDADLEFSIHKEKSRKNQSVIYVNVPNDKAIYKYFEEWVNPKDRSLNWCLEFIDELSNWDATVRKPGKLKKIRIKYDTTIESNADIVQQIAMFAGYGCTYSVEADNRKEIFSDVHSLTITSQTTVDGQGVKSQKVSYNGRVYCVQVPTGMIVVRRNKKAVVCGNSGDPETVVSEIMNILANKFGTTTNTKGFKVLKNVRVIQGDGVNEKSINEILQRLKNEGFSASNIAFGIGGSLLQKVNRDTLKFAYKTSAIVVDGKLRDVYKQPITDSGKNSKKGRLDLVKDENGKYETVRLPDVETLSAEDSQLRTVYENGELLIDDNLETIRKNVKRM